mmetsp:Transcript_48721/g.137746  ORF Transcript_48721/g.137746 Transcript_48721/m.137746 type:complete len:165 (-) Transcript_48721:183-677(-)|eukprot:CAMPEP_0179245316 /NCGR_PEP_ID=MMETSP0797-20121207/18510_1 /TAXON_ID=47934 /ORGANISM="Dinophysis acuminata, Strain DAEP01" /LENGTH=164 /DNA_ID=CAMNT_0020952859 /DNA_START=71 /DNA_END=565 /DNA_ORIENTATION=-
MLCAVAGRWLYTRDTGEDRFVLIEDTGHITFVGSDNPLELFLKRDTDGLEDQYLLENNEGTTCKATLEDDGDGGQQLLFEDEKGNQEVWHRTSAHDGSPKIIKRKSNGGVERRWSLEGQEGSEKSVEKKKSLTKALSTVAEDQPKEGAGAAYEVDSVSKPEAGA